MIKDKVKLALRLRGAAFDDEVTGLIAAAKADLRLVGIVFDDPPAASSAPPPGDPEDPEAGTSPENVTKTITPGDPEEPTDPEDPPEETPAGDPLIERAIILYCKAYFGYNQDSEKFIKVYDNLKIALSMAGGYNALE